VKGKQVRIKTFGPLFTPPRKNFLGTLSQVSSDAVTVEVEGAGAFTISLKDIARANLEYQL
jgi:ribosome maturation factor RimP